MKKNNLFSDSTLCRKQIYFKPTLHNLKICILPDKKEAKTPYMATLLKPKINLSDL